MTIEGSLGSGKTTLLQSLADLGYKVRLENVEAWTQLLQKYYAALDTRNAPLAGVRLQARIAVDACLADSDVDFEERCAYTQPSTFMQHMRGTGGLTAHHYDTLKALIRLLDRMPQCIIYLKCDPRVAIGRVQTRRRDCEKGVSMHYMCGLHEVYEQAVVEWRKEGLCVHEIDVTEMTPEQVLDKVLHIRKRPFEIL